LTVVQCECKNCVWDLKEVEPNICSRCYKPQDVCHWMHRLLADY